MLEHNFVAPSNFLAASMDSTAIYLSPPYHNHAMYSSELLYPPEISTSDHVLISSVQRSAFAMNAPPSPTAYSPPRPANSPESHSPSSSFSSEFASSPVQSTFDMAAETDANYQFASYPPEWQDNAWIPPQPQIYHAHERSLTGSDHSSQSNGLSPIMTVKSEIPLYTMQERHPASPQALRTSPPHLVSPIHQTFPSPISPQVATNFYDLQMMSTADAEHAASAFQRPPAPVNQGGCDPRFLSRNPTPDVASTHSTFPNVFTPAGPEISLSRESDDVSGEDEVFESEEDSAGSGHESKTKHVAPSDVLLEGGSGLTRRVVRPSRLTAPVPIPHLTKKSRGRRVPTSPTVIENGIEKSARTYVCDVAGCGKCFARGEHLKRHIRSIHTNEKPHKCPHPTCGKEFSRHDNLCQHMRVHRNYSASKST